MSMNHNIKSIVRQIVYKLKLIENTVVNTVTHMSLFSLNDVFEVNLWKYK